MKAAIIVLMCLVAAQAAPQFHSNFVDVHQRGLTDTIVNLLGLGSVWEEITSLGQGFVGQLLALGTQIIIQGQQAVAATRPILAQLVADLTAHTGNAVVIVQQAINQLTSTLTGGNGKRGVGDFVMNTLGLGAVWEEIQALGSGIAGQFTAVFTQLMFAGAEAWRKAAEIFTQLGADLAAHTGNAAVLVQQALQQLTSMLAGNGKRGIWETLGLGEVWDQITALGFGVVAQFMSIATQLLFAGKEIFDQAQLIFTQLASDLAAHTGNAATIVQQALQQVGALLAGGNGKRGIWDTLGLADVWDQITALGAGVVAQFFTIATQLLFAGKEIFAQAQLILSQLAADLAAHTGNAATIVQQAIQQLQATLAGNGKPRVSKRDLGDFVMETLGLGAVWAEIQALGSGIAGQFTAIFRQLLFAGTEAWKKAAEIFTQLGADLAAHTGNAAVLVQQAIQQLTSMLPGSGKRGVWETLGLGAVWQEITALGFGVVAQFMSIATQLLFVGKEIFAQAQTILAQLASDLLAHTGNAATIVQQSLQQLNALLGGSGKRDLWDTLGLGAVWQEITALGFGVVAQFMSIATQLLFAGKEIFAQAQVILSQLASDLLAHTGNAATIVQQAIQQLNATLQSGK